LLKEPFLALEKLLPEPAPGHPKFLIVFDEIATVYSRDNSKDIHAALRRILRSLRHFDIWTVFLSTNSRIRLFSPADGEDASERVFKGELAPIAPFFALPVSVAARQSLKIKGNAERLKPMSEYASASHFTQFGRPLWRIYSEQPYGVLRRFVTFKLLGGSERSIQPTHSMFSLCSLPEFASILTRTILNQSLFSESAVNSHLRLVGALDNKKGWLSTVTPSEPVVADAAAWLLMEDNTTSPEPADQVKGNLIAEKSSGLG
jgi:hypothetical protein